MYDSGYDFEYSYFEPYDHLTVEEALDALHIHLN